MKRIIQLILISSCLLFLCGCQSIFFLNDIPFSASFPQKTTASVDTVLTGLGKGIVVDYSPDKKMLLTIDDTNNGAAANNINLYRFNNSQYDINNLVSSNKRIIKAFFNSDRSGIFLSEENIIDNKQLIVWTSLDRTVTKTINNPDETVTSPPQQFKDNAIIYQNSKNDTVIADNNDQKRIITLNAPYVIQKAVYDAVHQGICFSAVDPNSEQKNLFYLYLDDGEKEILTPQTIAKNIEDFNLADNGRLLMLKNNGTNTDLYWIDPINRSKQRIAEGQFTAAVYSPEHRSIIAAKKSNMSDMQTLWIFNIDGSDPRQLTAPMILNSELFVAADKPCVYFSAYMNETISVDAPKESTVFSLSWKK